MEKAAAEEEKAQGTSLALTAKPSSSEITIKEFLDFLRTAYQVKFKQNRLSGVKLDVMLVV
jgi:hypothetical protein